MNMNVNVNVNTVNMHGVNVNIVNMCIVNVNLVNMNKWRCACEANENMLTKRPIVPIRHSHFNPHIHHSHHFAKYLYSQTLFQEPVEYHGLCGRCIWVSHFSH